MIREAIESPDGTGHGPGMTSGVKAAGLLFFSAIRDRKPGERKFSEDTEEQARQAFENLKTNLDGAGATLDHVVKSYPLSARSSVPNWLA